MPKTCRTCKGFNPYGPVNTYDKKQYGHCKRNPPAIVKGETSWEQRDPVVAEDEVRLCHAPLTDKQSVLDRIVSRIQSIKAGGSSAENDQLVGYMKKVVLAIIEEERNREKKEPDRY